MRAFIGKSMILGSFLLAGCASAGDVMPGENGYYRISAQAPEIAGGQTGAESAATTKATGFCARQGRSEALVTGEQVYFAEAKTPTDAGGEYDGNHPTLRVPDGDSATVEEMASVTLTFRCV